MADSEKSVGSAASTGDRGTPTPFKDSSGNYVVVTLDASGQLPVVLPPGGGGLTDTELRATAVPVSGTVAVTNAGITSIDGKVPALGQALAAASTPVVLTAAQITTLTPVAAITGFNLEATQLLVKAKTDNIPAQGQALAAASLPVVLTAAQITTLTPLATVAVTGVSTLAEQQTQTTALQLIDNAVSGAGFNITQQGGVAVSLNTGVRDTGTQRVTIATNDVVPVTDNSGSLTVDSPVGTPVFVRLSDGAAAITTLPVSLASVPTHAVTVASGGIASGAIASGAIASGAIASGAIASGAIASGAIAAGAIAAGATSIAENEDVAHATGDRGVKVWGTANEANTVRAADNDYVPFATDTEGNTRVVGNRDHDAVDAGEPMKVGARATNVEITAVANNDRTDLVATLTGKLITQPYSNTENFVSGAITTAMTGTTTTSLVAAPAAGIRNYLTTIIVSNAHATVGTDIVIQDGSGGTTLLTIPAAALYGGAAITLPVPLRQPTTATAIFCANVTTGASTKVSAVGYRAV